MSSYKFTNAYLSLQALWKTDPTLARKIKYIKVGTLTNEQYENAALYDGSETDIHDKKYSGEVNRVYQDEAGSKIANVEAIFNPKTRGWNVREVGLFLEEENPGDDPVLAWIGKVPDTFVPVDYEDMQVGEIITVPIEHSNIDTVVLYTTNAALATIDYVENESAANALHILENSQEIGLIKNKLFGG